MRILKKMYNDFEPNAHFRHLYYMVKQIRNPYFIRKILIGKDPVYKQVHEKRLLSFTSNTYMLFIDIYQL